MKKYIVVGGNPYKSYTNSIQTVSLRKIGEYNTKEEAEKAVNEEYDNCSGVIDVFHIDIQEKEHTTHSLKTWPCFYEDILQGKKLFELRKNDRNFKVGDTVHFVEWDPTSGLESGRACTRKISYILHPEELPHSMGLGEGYCIFGIEEEEIDLDAKGHRCLICSSVVTDMFYANKYAGTGLEVYMCIGCAEIWKGGLGHWEFKER